MVDRKNAVMAIIYHDTLTLHKILAMKSEPIMTIQFKGALQDLDLNAIDHYLVNEHYIYILSRDILYIINLND